MSKDIYDASVYGESEIAEVNYMSGFNDEMNMSSSGGMFKKKIISFLREETSIIWIIFGTIGNMLTLFVLCKHKMRKHSTFTYLTILSLCDTLVLYFGLFRDYLVYKHKIDVDGDFLCKFHVFFFYFVLHMASWLLVAVNIDRLIAASFLSFSKTWCTPKIAVLVSMSLAVIFAMINSHFIFFVTSSRDSKFYQNQTIPFSALTRQPQSRRNITMHGYSSSSYNYSIQNNKFISIPQFEEYESVNPFVYSKCLIKTNWPKYNYFFINIFTWIDAGAQVILPFIIMVICNVNIIYKVLLTKKKTNGKNSKRLRRIKGMCIMIISVSIIFFVLEMPVLIFLCLMQGKFHKDDLTMDLLWTLVNLMMYTNHVINFFSYCMTGTKFRRELLHLICIDFKCIKDFPNYVNRFPALFISSDAKTTQSMSRFKQTTKNLKKGASNNKRPELKTFFSLSKNDEFENTVYFDRDQTIDKNIIIEEDLETNYPSPSRTILSKRVNFEEINFETTCLTTLVLEKKRRLKLSSDSSDSFRESPENNPSDEERRPSLFASATVCSPIVTRKQTSLKKLKQKSYQKKSKWLASMERHD